MTVRLKHILTLVVLLLLTAAAAVNYAFMKKERMKHSCTGLSVEVVTSEGLVGADDVQKLVTRTYGAYLGQRIDSLRLSNMEEIVLTSIQAAEKCEAYVTDDDTLRIAIHERVPVMVIRQEGRANLLVDKTAEIFPDRKGAERDLPSVKGTVPVNDKEWVTSLLSFMEVLGKEMSGCELMVKGNGDIEMLRSGMNEKFLLGYPYDAKDKLRRMNDYISTIQPLGKNYKSVNLKYKDQIICK